MKESPYTDSYYMRQEGGSVSSAKIVVPLLIDYIAPRSVIDIGCGVGTWLSVFKEHGVQITGFDGAWVKEEQLHIPASNFFHTDIENASDIGRTADLAISLEVGEHLSKEAAPKLVTALVKAAPVVCFSAAIPLQGGTRHINEQWPSYWAKIFREHGYVPIDCIREKIWNSPVEYWYAQNAVIYVDEKKLHLYPKHAALAEVGYPDPLSLVHPQKFLYVAERYKLLEPLFKIFPWSLLRAGKRVLLRMRSR